MEQKEFDDLVAAFFKVAGATCEHRIDRGANDDEYDAAQIVLKTTDGRRIAINLSTSPYEDPAYFDVYGEE